MAPISTWHLLSFRRAFIWRTKVFPAYIPAYSPKVAPGAGQLCPRRGRTRQQRGSPGTRHPPPPPSSEHLNQGGSGAPGSPARGYTSFPARAGFPAAASGSAKSREAGRPLLTSPSSSPLPAPAPYLLLQLHHLLLQLCHPRLLPVAGTLGRHAVLQFPAGQSGRQREISYPSSTQPFHHCPPLTCAAPSPPGSGA